MTDTTTLAAAAAVAAFVVGFLKTSVGGGIGLTLTPVLSLFLPAQAVLALIAVLLNLSNPIALRYYWRRWDARQLRLLLPATLAGIVLGGWAIAGLSDYWLKKAIGAAGLVFALFQLAAMRRPIVSGAQGGGLAARAVGLLVGFASSVAHSGGVILGTYLVGLGLGNVAVVATGAAVVAVADVLKLATYWTIGFLTWPVVVAAVPATPLIYLGAWLGVRLNAWLPRRWLGLALIVIAIVGSLKLLAP